MSQFDSTLFNYGLASYPGQESQPPMGVSGGLDMFGNGGVDLSGAGLGAAPAVDQNQLAQLYVQQFNDTAENRLRHYLRSAPAWAANAGNARAWLQNPDQVVGYVPGNSTTDTPGRQITANERLMFPMQAGDPGVNAQMIAANPGLAPKVSQPPVQAQPAASSIAAAEDEDFKLWKQQWMGYNSQPRYGLQWSPWGGGSGGDGGDGGDGGSGAD